MKKLENKNIYYYKTYSDDVVQSQNQNYKLPSDYVWIHNNILYKLCSKILYFITFIIIYFYEKIFLRVKIINRDILKKYEKQGYFLYGNHTQTIGDVFMPALVCRGKRIYTIASQANLGVAFIGKILPMLGALPIPDSMKKMRDMCHAVYQRIDEKNCVVIYPEAHVWPYYTKIRPFPLTAFRFPMENDTISFCMTTTYYKRKFFKKPGIKIYVDGPFFPDKSLMIKDRQKKLHDEIYDTMVKRSKNSTYKFVEYKEEK